MCVHVYVRESMYMYSIHVYIRVGYQNHTHRQTHARACMDTHTHLIWTSSEKLSMERDCRRRWYSSIPSEGAREELWRRKWREGRENGERERKRRGT